MITNIRIDLTDQQRVDLANLFGTGRTFSRKDVNALVTGCIDAALEVSTQPIPQSTRKGGMSRVDYFRNLERHLRKQGNVKGAMIAASTVNQLENTE